MIPGELIDTLTVFDIGEYPSDDAIVDALTVLGTARNLIDHHAATLAADVERRGIARKRGLRPVELLMRCGAAPAVASRWVRVGRGLATTPMLGGHAELGGVSSEMCDALIKGFRHITTRAAEPLDDQARHKTMNDLLAQAVSGATPAEVSAHARVVGNALAHPDDDDDDGGGVPAAEDRRISSLTFTEESDGRVTVRGDLDVVIAEKLISTIDPLAAPRPEPDGSPDTRSLDRRQAEALEAALDMLAQADTTLIGTPKTNVTLMIPVDMPERAELQFMGPVTAITARMLACDSAITEIVIDGNGVPLSVSEERRFFVGKDRKALIARDGCCIKCGAHASRAHGHHILAWSTGGTTTLDNGCLLCPSCHSAVHNDGWDVVIGHDRHPWLIPPATIDPRRRRQPSYRRRTMRLDDIAA